MSMLDDITVLRQALQDWSGHDMSMDAVHDLIWTLAMDSEAEAALRKAVMGCRAESHISMAMGAVNS